MTPIPCARDLAVRRAAGIGAAAAVHRARLAGEIGESQRVLPYAITERFLTEGSTVEQIRHQAGIVTVERYEAMGGR